MIAHDRHKTILEILRRKQRVALSELLKLTRCSPATLRRDIQQLADHDLLVRVHGAILDPALAGDEPTLTQKSRRAVAEKRRIGEVAAGHVPPGATVFIDSGTTCFEAARHLRERADLTLVTNSLAVAATHELCRARLIVLGGERRATSGALVGNLALAGIRSLHADVAIVGASGLDHAAGPGTTELSEMDVKQAWIARARACYLACDSSKWESAATFCFADWSQFTGFITDAPPPKSFRLRHPRIHLA